jgi:hypothetical protein
MMSSAFIDTVAWGELEHAYGAASDIPPLLKQIATLKGRKLHEPIGELYSRVLHQGTIYSASPPVAQVVIEMLGSADLEQKTFFYDLLDGFCEASRRAYADGRAIPGHAGGDPEDGRAIESAILAGAAVFVPDLTHAEADIRRCVANLLTAFPTVTPESASLVRERWFVETDATVRSAMVTGLARARGSFADWMEFLEKALDKERDANGRYLLRLAQVDELKASADSAAVDDLIRSFVEANAGDYFLNDDGRFFEVLQGLGEERHVAGLLEAFRLATNRELLRVLAERLLRVVFEDQRTDWGQTASSLLREDGAPPPQPDMSRQTVKLILKLILWKIFPFMRRRQIRKMTQNKPKGIRKVDYWGLKGTAPEIPARLTETQRKVLMTLGEKVELWKFRTNLWELFGLPGEAEGIRRFAMERSA